MELHTTRRIDRQCLSKKKHCNENSARGAVNAMWKNHRIKGDYYYCEYCGGYHITKLRQQDA